LDKVTGLSCESFMNSLAKYFDSSLLTIVRDNPNYLSPVYTYYFSVESISKLEKVVNYFSIYPLMGVKGLDSLDFIKVYTMIKNKEHLTDSGRDQIKLIKFNKSNKINQIKYK